MQSKAATILGFSLMLGLAALGFLVQQMAVKFKEYERVVNVKGLAEQEVAADTVIWPIQFTVADNQVGSLFETLEQQSGLITAFLQQSGVEASAISRAAPNVIDKKAQQYGEGDRAEFRYIASQTLTVYSKDVAKIRGLISAIGQLGRQGIVFNQDPYQNRVEYSFTALNELKPQMIEEATKQAREVALKFAQDSQSQLGKIKTASQGQFSISDRDANTPHIKKVRVVTTVEYYLSD